MSIQIPLGSIVAYAASGESIPTGWLLCDGSLIDVARNPDLVTLIGKYLPDLRGRTLIGGGTSLNDSMQSDGTIPNFPVSGFELGTAGGECNHQLSITEVPSHVHDLVNGTFSEAGGGHDFSTPPGSTNKPTYDNPNSAASHNNMQPYYVVNYIICAVDA